MNVKTKLDYSNGTFVPSRQTMEQVRALSHLNVYRSLWPLVFDWGFSLGMIWLSLHVNSALLYLISVLVVGTRQHALLIVVHEGVHYRLSNNRRLNDWISDVFAAFPIFFCTHGYRLNHLAHHRHLNTEKDPDWARKSHLREWQFPQAGGELLRTMTKVMVTSWWKMIQLFWTLSGVSHGETWSDPTRRRVLLKKIAFYGFLAVCLSATSSWGVFARYWLVPYLFVMPLVERVRSISEHFGISYQHDLQQTRDILSSPIEGFFFGPHNIRYHLVHHLFPTVPQYRLPELHTHLMEVADYAEHAHQNTSYIFGNNSVLNDIIQPKGDGHVEAKV